MDPIPLIQRVQVGSRVRYSPNRRYTDRIDTYQVMEMPPLGFGDDARMILAQVIYNQETGTSRTVDNFDYAVASFNEDFSYIPHPEEIPLLLLPGMLSLVKSQELEAELNEILLELEI